MLMKGSSSYSSSGTERSFGSSVSRQHPGLVGAPGVEPGSLSAADFESAALPNIRYTKERVFDITGAVLDTLFRRARDRAAVDCPSVITCRFHDARGEAITRLSRKLDVLELARVVGHRNLSSLLHYYKASAAEIAKKLD